MRALLTAMIAAVEACAIALAGLVLIAIPALLMWWLVFDLAAEPEVVAKTISGLWFLGHLTPLEFVLDPETALSFGLAPELLRVSISLVPLGLTLLTVLLAFRAGWRFANRGGSGIAGVIGGVLGFAAATWSFQFFGNPMLGSAPWLATLIASACFAVGGLGGFIWCSALNGHAWWHSSVQWIQHRVGRAGAALPDLSRDVLRYLTGGLAALLGLGALGFTGALVLGYVEIVTLSQSMQLDLLGVLLLFLFNLLMLPTACIWSIAWFSGVGFSVGAGTSVSPFETLLGPLPALPILGAIPPSWGWAAVLAPLLIVLIGVLLGAALSGSIKKRDLRWPAAILPPILAAVLVGLLITALAALSSGSLGPGRLRVNGPDPWFTGLAIALELGCGLVLGVIARRLDGGRLRQRFVRETDPQPLPPIEPVEPQIPTVPDIPATQSSLSSFNTRNAEAETVPLDPLPRLGTTDLPPDSTTLAANANPEDIVRAYAWGEDMSQVSGEGDTQSRPQKRNWWSLRRKG